LPPVSPHAARPISALALGALLFAVLNVDLLEWLS
jgi:hypothetical protein